MNNLIWVSKESRTFSVPLLFMTYYDLRGQLKLLDRHGDKDKERQGSGGEEKRDRESDLMVNNYPQ